METLTMHLSNAFNIMFLVGIMVISLIRLADGLKDLVLERISLVLVLIGSFFMLLKAAHPSRTSFEVLFFNAGWFLWISSQVYRHSLSQFEKWKSR